MGFKKMDGTEEFARFHSVEQTAVYIGSMTDLVNVTNELKWRQDEEASAYGETIEVLSLNEIAEQCHGKGGLITVIYERPTGGAVYQYGNYGDVWYRIGDLMGYA